MNQMLIEIIIYGLFPTIIYCLYYNIHAKRKESRNPLLLSCQFSAISGIIFFVFLILSDNGYIIIFLPVIFLCFWSTCFISGLYYYYKNKKQNNYKIIVCNKCDYVNKLFDNDLKKCVNCNNQLNI